VTHTAETGATNASGGRIVCRDCSAAEAELARQKWSMERPRLVRHFRRLPHAHLYFTLVVTKEHSDYEARLTLSLEWATLAARAAAKAVDTAIRVATTRLEREIAEHLSRLRREEVIRRLRQRRADIESAGPALAADRGRNDKRAFVEALRSSLPRLRELARHEVQIAQLEGRILEGEVTARDLLDELLLRAWHRYYERPGDEALDTWLVRLLHDTTDEVLGGGMSRRESLDEEIAFDPELIEEESDVARPPVWPSTQDVTLSELIPDASASEEPESEEAEPFVESEELQRLVLEALRNVPAPQRRAFALATVDGWTAEEIGMLLRRPPDLVRADIAEVRERVREYLIRTLAR
jgi:RNA polymerase sigma factor (sigma-70 family)